MGQESPSAEHFRDSRDILRKKCNNCNIQREPIRLHADRTRAAERWQTSTEIPNERQYNHTGSASNPDLIEVGVLADPNVRRRDVRVRNPENLLEARVGAHLATIEHKHTSTSTRNASAPRDLRGTKGRGYQVHNTTPRVVGQGSARYLKGRSGKDQRFSMTRTP